MRTILVMPCMLLLSCFASADNNQTEDNTMNNGADIQALHKQYAENPSIEKLRDAWQDFINGISQGRDGVDTALTAKAPLPPIPIPPDVPTDRNLVDGYRYVLGYITRIIEEQAQQDGRFPYFNRSMTLLSKWTGDNSDQIYLNAVINAHDYYKIEGQAANIANWKYNAPHMEGPKAPRVFTITTGHETIGDTGSLGEFDTCRNQTLTTITSFDLEVEPDGRFSILVGPEKPKDYTGNFMFTKARLPCQKRDGSMEYHDREATNIVAREIFNDWENETQMELNIVNLTHQGRVRPPQSVDDMANSLKTIGDKVANQVLFWSTLQHLALEVNGDIHGDGSRAIPVNGFNQPAPPFVAGDSAAAKNLTSGGVYELMTADGKPDPDKALIVKVTYKPGSEPHYHGFHLYDYWMASLDYANAVSSRNGYQAHKSTDGSIYYVVAHRDPGVQNWLDTTGLPRGSMVQRFNYPEEPSVENRPLVKAKEVPFSEISKHLPANTPSYSEQQRKAEISIRQAHVQKRMRQY